MLERWKCRIFVNQSTGSAECEGYQPDMRYSAPLSVLSAELHSLLQRTEMMPAKFTMCDYSDLRCLGLQQTSISDLPLLVEISSSHLRMS